MTVTLRAPVRARLLGALIACVACGESPAVVFEGLYTITVPVDPDPAAGRPPQSEDDYVRLAMGQLLTRVTGRPDAFLEPALADLVRNAAQYVVRRGYPDRENLLVAFDPMAVEEALVSRNQPVWGPERPLTLLWLAVDAGFGERTILAAEAPESVDDEELAAVQDQLREELAAAAGERGLPIALPLWDLEDMRALDIVDVWGGFGDRVRRASERYGADAVLSARVRVTGSGIFDVQWTLLRDRGQFVLPGRTLRSGLDRLADLYASEFSSLGGASLAQVTVDEVQSLEDYGRVMRYMEGLSVLSSVDVEEFAGASLTLRVTARGGPAVLERVLTLSDVLRRLPPAADDPAGNHLRFALSR